MRVSHHESGGRQQEHEPSVGFIGIEDGENDHIPQHRFPSAVAHNNIHGIEYEESYEESEGAILQTAIVKCEILLQAR